MSVKRAASQIPQGSPYHHVTAANRLPPLTFVRLNIETQGNRLNQLFTHRVSERFSTHPHLMICAVEVTGFEHLSVELGRMRIPTQRYAVFTHDGHVSKLKETWDAIWSGWLPGSGHQTANTPDFEVYDERFDPKTGWGVIEIWFPIHP